MLESISTEINVCCRGYAAMNPYALHGSAVSPEAQAVTNAASALIQSEEESQALFGERAEAISRLRELAIDCSEIGWDGAEASPIKSEALHNAIDFIRTLPEGIPIPECAPEPDGSISLDWIVTRYRLFSLSIGQTNRLAYAWLDGSDKGHGVARFDGLLMPLRVLSGIKSILRQHNATFWLACTNR